MRTNQRAWNLRTWVHVGSPFYDFEGVRAGASSLHPPELELMGPVAGQRLLHLQCHFGLDSVSWARRGARVTGVDLSPVALTEASRLAREVAIDVQFVCADVHALPVAAGTFDLAVSTYGVICWIEDLDAWAGALARALAPGGRFILVEFHPILETVEPGSVSGTGRYFNDREPRLTTTTGTYTDRQAPIAYSEYRWQHPVADVVAALLTNGLTLRALREFECCPYPLVEGVSRDVDGMYSWSDGCGARWPLMYGLVAEASR